jgi:hypothetical protein
MASNRESGRPPNQHTIVFFAPMNALPKLALAFDLLALGEHFAEPTTHPQGWLEPT